MNTVAVETIAKYLATIITPKTTRKIATVEFLEFQILVTELQSLLKGVQGDYNIWCERFREIFRKILKKNPFYLCKIFKTVGVRQIMALWPFVEWAWPTFFYVNQ